MSGRKRVEVEGGDFERPTALAFDLDPGPPADVLACCQVALLLRRLLDRLGLASFPKTSGSKGLQVYVPLDGTATYDVTKTFAHATARLLSLRARPRPTVSTPLRWSELERAARDRRAGALVFEARDVLARVARSGDLFAPVLSLRQRLPDASALGRASAR